MRRDVVLYRHIRLDTNVVFYIGIGKGDRSTQKKNRNLFWKNITNKTDYRVDILFEDLTWDEACEKEREFIKLYGRRDLGLGTLVNMTDGGDGTTGVKRKPFSKLHRERLSKSHTGKKLTDSHKENISISNSKVKHTDEWNKKVSDSRIGFNFTEESKRKMSLSHIDKNVTPIIQKDMDDNIVKVWSSIKDAVLSGYNRVCISDCCRGVRQKTHKGFQWEYKNKIK